MGETINSLTIGELMGFGVMLLTAYSFIKSLIIPIVKKWLKIHKTAADLTDLKALPGRVTVLETKTARDYTRLNTIDEVNVLMMMSLRALLRNRISGNDVAVLKETEAKVDDFLVGKGVTSGKDISVE